MARQYTAGTATDGGGSATTNMTNLQATLRTIITANAAWSLVETINGSTNVVDVYKCAAASSGLSKDFYVVIYRTVSSGQHNFLVGEDYNSSTHVLSNVACGWNASVRAVDAATGLFNPASTATFNASTGVLSGGGATPLATSNTTPAATVAYAIVVDSDHLMIRAGANSRYIGAVESLVTAVADPMPIVMMSLSNNQAISSNQNGSTRNPGIAAAGLSQSHAINDALNANNVDLYPVAGVRDFAVSDPWVGGPAAYELGATNTSSAGTGLGAIRGRVKKTKRVVTPPVGTALGDTFTIAGRQWPVVGVTSQYACIVDPGP